MKGEHLCLCEKFRPECLCNRCKHDGRGVGACCIKNSRRCSVENCPDFEPDDEEDDHA